MDDVTDDMLDVGERTYNLDIKPRSTWRERLAKTFLAMDAARPPINMVLHCPSCHTQHIDAPDGDWTNPPHLSHLCAKCGTIWRPADVTTNGVVTIDTVGTKDTWIATESLSDSIAGLPTPESLWTPGKDALLRELAEWAGHTAPLKQITNSLRPFIEAAFPEDEK